MNLNYILAYKLVIRTYVTTNKNLEGNNLMTDATLFKPKSD